jgi:hypothetical protein
MYEIKDAQGVVNNHTTISSLGSFLKNSRYEPEYLEFIKDRIRFAYPKTIWMQLSVDDNADATGLKTRLTLPLELGKHLAEWFATAKFRRIVFDFRNVTLFDLRRLLEFLRVAAEKLKAPYYLCDRLLAPLLIERGVDASRIYDNDRLLLRELRHASDLERCNVGLPIAVSADCIDRALTQYASPERINSSDVVVFDMSDVQEIDFEAAAMFTPYIHTLASRYGLLTCFANFRRKVLRGLQDLGALRPVFPYVIGSPAPAPAGLGDRGDILPMHSFTDEQLTDINNLCLQGALRILKIEPKWLNPASRIPVDPDWGPSRHRTGLIFNLLNTINELNENVARHAGSQGHIMMQLDVNRGLSLYIGDSGIGLADGLSRDYDLKVASDLEAARLAFRLRQYREKRRNLGHGHGGRGLTKVRKILSELNGRIKLQTGSAIALFSGRRHTPSESSDDHFFVQGTHYNLFIPTPKQLAR